MCENAWGDIKDALNPELLLNLYYCTRHRCFAEPISDYYECPKARAESMCNGERDWIELPTQDQLQEMLGNELGELLELLNKYSLYYIDDNGIRSDFWFVHRLTSMEQLWLAFVMKEKYGKVWNGENWIKEE